MKNDIMKYAGYENHPLLTDKMQACSILMRHLGLIDKDYHDGFAALQVGENR